MDAAGRRWIAALVVVIALASSAGASRSPAFGVSLTSAPPRGGARYTIDVTGRESVPPDPRRADDPVLRQAIESALPPGDLAHASVVVRRLRDGRGVRIRAERELYAASTFKLAVLFALERAAARGEVDMDGRLVIHASEAAEDLGTLARLPLAADGSLPIRDAARAMIELSDNATAVAFLHRLGAANVNHELRAIGITGMDVNVPGLPTSAAALARVMEAVVQGEGVDAAARTEMRQYLLGQQTRSGIPAGLPATVPVGNKTGTWPGITHDVAFVDAPNGAYVIAVLTDEGWSWDRVAKISRAVYDVLSRD